MPRSSRATPEQLGVANRPDLHGRDAPILTDEHDDEFLNEVPVVKTPAERMRFRARPTYGPPPGPATEADQVGAHMTGGSPDPRRLWGNPTQAGYPEPQQEGLRPSAEDLVQVRPVLDVDPAGPPVRYSAGSTGEDASRAARWPIALFFRPFDKAMPEQFASLDRIEQASPQASTPLTPGQDVPGRYPSPGGGLASPGIGPHVAASPNTFRLVPRPWDELAIMTGLRDGTLPPSAEGARRAGGWRARG